MKSTLAQATNENWIDASFDQDCSNLSKIDQSFHLSFYQSYSLLGYIPDYALTAAATTLKRMYLDDSSRFSNINFEIRKIYWLVISFL